MQKKLKILNIRGEGFAQEGKQILEQLGQVDYVDINSEKELLEKIEPYDVLVVGLTAKITSEILTRGKNLKIVATSTTGTDHIDLEAAKKKGVTVVSLKDDREFLNSVTSTAELAFALMLIVSRNLLPAMISVRQQNWDEKFMGHSLYAKTLGIVGLGRLGSMMARFAKPFNMKVVATDPGIGDDYFKQLGVEKLSLPELLKQSDFVSIHVHLSKETEGLFNLAAFSAMKPSAYLINTSRGKIVDEADLLKALEKRYLAGYATDVLDGELSFVPGLAEHPLIAYSKTHANVIITPHVGGVTAESREATDIFTAKKLVKLLQQ